MDPWGTPQFIRPLSEKLSYIYTKLALGKITFKRFCNVISKAHTYIFPLVLLDL